MHGKRSCSWCSSWCVSVGFIALDNRAGARPAQGRRDDLVVPVTDRSPRSVADRRRSRPSWSQLATRDAEARYDQLLAENAQLMVNAREVEKLRELLELAAIAAEPDVRPARVLHPRPDRHPEVRRSSTRARPTASAKAWRSSIPTTTSVR